MTLVQLNMTTGDEEEKQPACRKLFTCLMSSPSGQVLYSMYMQTFYFTRFSLCDELCFVTGHRQSETICLFVNQF